MPYDDSDPRRSAIDAVEPPSAEVRPKDPAPRQPEQAAPPAAPAQKPGDEANDADQARKRRRPWVLVIVAILAILAIAGGVTWWLMTRDLVTTDDAYTDGRVITVAPKVGGYVTVLNVNDNQRVHAGDLLVQIDQRDYITARDQAKGQLAGVQGQLDAARAALDVARDTIPAKLAAAEAQVESARAGLTRAQADYRRQTSISAAATTRQNIDQATATQREAAATLAEAEANLRQAQPVEQLIAESAAKVTDLEGQVAEAKAKLAQAELNLSYTTVVAPQDGWVTKRNVERGDLLTAGSSIMSLVTPEIWVTANFKETQLTRMRPGQQVDISVDSIPICRCRSACPWTRPLP
jgi:membrane fusion protein (multidrug efflux system)